MDHILATLDNGSGNAEMFPGVDMNIDFADYGNDFMNEVPPIDGTAGDAEGYFVDDDGAGQTNSAPTAPPITPSPPSGSAPGAALGPVTTAPNTEQPPGPRASPLRGNEMQRSIGISLDDLGALDGQQPVVQEPTQVIPQHRIDEGSPARPSPHQPAAQVLQPPAPDPQKQSLNPPVSQAWDVTYRANAADPTADDNVEVSRNLQVMADGLVKNAWRSSMNSTAFISSVKTSLLAESQAEGTSFEGWELAAAPEKALLTALLRKMVHGEALSTRLFNYLKEIILVGLVHPRAALRAIIRTVVSSTLSFRVQEGLARFLSHMLPWYNMTSTGPSLDRECIDFLTGIALVLDVVLKCPAAEPLAIELIGDERSLALARAAGRRHPAKWNIICDQVRQLTAGISKRSHFLSCLVRLRGGLSSNSSSALHPFGIGDDEPGGILPSTLAKLSHHASRLLGTDVFSSVAICWSKGEPEQKGDIDTLISIDEYSNASPLASRPIRDRVRLCERIIKQLTEAAGYNPRESERWVSAHWGGRQRLSRLIRDVLPQIKTRLQGEFSSLMVACAVVGCCAISLGSRVAPRTPQQDGTMSNGQSEPIGATDEEIEEIGSELCTFAISCLEESATSEEPPAWKTLGIWLLLLASRVGSLLRDSCCDHVHAAKVLRVWGVVTAGHGNSNSLDSATAITVCSTTALAVIDASDTEGSEQTLHALSSDAVQ